MRIYLIIAALICGIIATVLGFQFLDEPGWNEDYPGWLALALTFWIASDLAVRVDER